MLGLTRRYLPVWFYVGVIIILSLLVGIVLKIKFFLLWATPIFLDRIYTFDRWGNILF